MGTSLYDELDYRHALLTKELERRKLILDVF